MKRDFHMHPQIIQNPAGFAAFAQKAIEEGIQEICITDHMPLMGNKASDRIPTGKVKQYCHQVRDLAEKYKSSLSVKCGIEIDYHPEVAGEIEAVLKEGEFDFILGSSHLHAIGQLKIFEKTKTQNGYVEAMLNNTLKAVRSGYFQAIAHIDMYKWIFENPTRFPLAADDFAEEKHGELIEEVLEAMKKQGMFLEMNPHLAAEGKDLSKVYPSVTIVERALQKGVSFCYGSDAHKAEHVGILLEELRTHEIYGKALKGWEEGA